MKAIEGYYFLKPKVCTRISRRAETVHAHQARPAMKMSIEAKRKTAGKMILQ